MGIDSLQLGIDLLQFHSESIPMGTYSRMYKFAATPDLMNCWSCDDRWAPVIAINKYCWSYQIETWVQGGGTTSDLCTPSWLVLIIFPWFPMVWSPHCNLWDILPKSSLLTSTVNILNFNTLHFSRY